MKQDVMSCSAKAPMCPCYKALAEKKGAEDDFMGFEYYYLVDSDGNKSNDFPSLEEAQIARSYVPHRNLKIMRRRHEGRNMVGKTTEITEFDPYEEQLKNPNYFKNNYRAETFEAGCVGCQMQKPVSKKERAAIQEQIDKFNEQLSLDPEDDFERYVLLDLDDDNLVEKLNKIILK